MKVQPNTWAELKQSGIVLAGILAMVIPYFVMLPLSTHLIYHIGDGQDPSFYRPIYIYLPLISVLATFATAKVQRNAGSLLQALFWLALFQIGGGYLIFWAGHPGTTELRNNRCLMNQKHLAQACILFAEEHAGRFPVKTDLPAGLRVEERYFECRYNGYMINGHLLGKELGEIDDPQGALLTADGYNDPLFGDPKIEIGRYSMDINSNHDYNDQRCAFASFADGHVGMLYPPQSGKTYVLPERNAP